MAEKLGEATLELKTDATGFDKGMDRAEKRTQNLKKAFKIGAVAALAAAAVFAKLAKSAIDTADNYAKMSRKVGISVESLSAFDFAAKLAGTSIDAMQSGLARMAANAADASRGVGEGKEAFDQLGISVTDASGKIQPMENLLLQVADRFAEMEDGTEKTALAMDIFGRAGLNMIPMLNAGSKGLAGMKAEAEALGIVISSKTAEQSERFNDALLKLGSSLQGIIFAILDSGLLEIMVNLSETMAAASTEGTFFTSVGKLLTGVFKTIQIGALSVQLRFQKLILDILSLVDKSNKLLGSWSPFKKLTKDLTGTLDQYKLKVSQTTGKIKEIKRGTDKLKASSDKLKRSTEKLIKPTKNFGEAAKKAADEIAKAKKKMDDWIRTVNRSLNPSKDLIDKFKLLTKEGKTNKEILFALGSQLEQTVDDLREMGKEIPKEIEAILAMRNSIVDISGLVPALEDLGEGADRAKNRLGFLSDATGDVAKKIIDEGRPSVDEWAESLRENNRAVTDLGEGFSDFLGGIDSDIVPGIGKIKSVFDSVMGTVNGFIGTINSIIGLFSEGGAFSGVIGGLGKFSDLFGGGGEGGGISGIFSGLTGGGGGSSGGGGGLTTSFTELAITGVAIQTGIFGTGVSLTGITIQKGEFNTGVSLTGFSLGFGGSGKSKEIAFNTRQILGWIEGFFPTVNQIQVDGIKAVQRVIDETVGVKFWTELIAHRMDTLIGIQRDMIAPAVEGIRTRLDQTINVNVANTINVNIKNTGEVATAVGGSVASQNRDLIAEIKRQIQTNQFGLRSEIAKVS